jgi:hypothetical protein
MLAARALVGRRRGATRSCLLGLLATLAPALAPAPAGAATGPAIAVAPANPARTVLDVRVTAGPAQVCEFLFGESSQAAAAGVRIVSVSGRGTLSSSTPLPGALFGWRWEEPLKAGSSWMVQVDLSGSYPPSTSHGELFPNCGSGVGAVTADAPFEATLTPHLTEAAAATRAAIGEDGTLAASVFRRRLRPGFIRDVHKAIAELEQAHRAAAEALAGPDAEVSEPTTAHEVSQAVRDLVQALLENRRAARAAAHGPRRALADAVHSALGDEHRALSLLGPPPVM